MEPPMPQWPRSQLLRHGPELPMAERVRRYQHNIRIIRASGCRVPTLALADTLDPKEIEAWFVESDATSHRLKTLIGQLARLPLPDDAEVPSPCRSR
jgi:hypothetical protein